MFCPLSDKLELSYLYKYYPDKFELLMSLARNTEKELLERRGHKCSMWCGNPKYDTDYIENIIKTKWIKIYNEREVHHELIQTFESITRRGSHYHCSGKL